MLSYTIDSYEMYNASQFVYVFNNCRSRIEKVYDTSRRHQENLMVEKSPVLELKDKDNSIL